MFRFQIALAIILVSCIAILSCGRAQEMLEDPVPEEMPTDMILDLINSGMYTSWPSSVEYSGARDTGVVHGEGARTVYFNAEAAKANEAGEMYPLGSIIVKEILDDENTFLAKVAVMIKSDDANEDHNGWVYKKYARASTDAEYMQVKGSNLGDAGNGCHNCHAKAANDSVFVSLISEATMDDPMDKQMFEITLTNLTMGEHGMSGQTFSPAIFVAHRAGVKLAVPGEPANEALVAMAEGGDISLLAALATAAEADVAIAMNADGTNRYTMPGQSTTVTVTADMVNSSLSIGTMLVSTNDAFIAAIDVPLFDEAGMAVTATIDLMAYDAGSEDNTEMASDIPGPLGLDPEVDPAGSNARVPTEGGVIMPHPGIQGGADVSEAFAWTEPIATLTITPVDADMNYDMDTAEAQ